METRLEVSRGPHGLRVYLPNGRTLDMGTGSAALQFLERMLRDADENACYRRERQAVEARRGYIGDFPTQHILDIWRKEACSDLDEQVAEIKEKKRLDAKLAKEQKWAQQGVDLNEMEFKL